MASLPVVVPFAVVTKVIAVPCAVSVKASVALMCTAAS